MKMRAVCLFLFLALSLQWTSVPLQAQGELPDLVITGVTFVQSTTDPTRPKLDTIRVRNIGTARTISGQTIFVEFGWMKGDGTRIMGDDVPWVSGALLPGEEKTIRVSEHISGDLTAPDGAGMLFVQVDPRSANNRNGIIAESNEYNNEWADVVAPDLILRHAIFAQDPTDPTRPVFHSVEVENRGLMPAGIRDSYSDIEVSFAWVLPDGQRIEGEDTVGLDYLAGHQTQTVSVGEYVGLGSRRAPENAMAIEIGVRMLGSNTRQLYREVFVSNNEITPPFLPDLVVEGATFIPVPSQPNVGMLDTITIKNAGSFSIGAPGRNRAYVVATFEWIKNDGTVIAGDDDLVFDSFQAGEVKTVNVDSFVSPEFLRVPDDVVSLRVRIDPPGASNPNGHVRESRERNNEWVTPILPPTLNPDIWADDAEGDAVDAILSTAVDASRSGEPQSASQEDIRMPDLTFGIVDLVEAGYATPVIRNMGRASSTPAVLEYYSYTGTGERVVLLNTVVEALGPGQTASPRVALNGAPVQNGMIRVGFFIDASRIVPENNEQNNVWEMSVMSSTGTTTRRIAEQGPPEEGTESAQESQQRTDDDADIQDVEEGEQDVQAPVPPKKERTVPRVLPGNPLYFFKDIGHGLRIAFAGSPEKKSELRLHYANDRVLEAHLLDNRGKKEAAAKHAAKYARDLAALNASLETLAKKDQDKADAIAQAGFESGLHAQVLLGKFFRDTDGETLLSVKNARDASLRELGTMAGTLDVRTVRNIVADGRANGADVFRDLRYSEILQGLETYADEQVQNALAKEQEALLQDISTSLRGFIPEKEKNIKEYLMRAGGDDVLYLKVLDELRVRKGLDEEIVSALIAARERVLVRLEDRLNDSSEAGHLLRHVDGKTFADLRILQEVDVRASDEVKARIAPYLDQAERTLADRMIEAGTAIETDVLFTTDITRFPDVKQLHVLERVQRVLPEDKKYVAGIAERALTERIIRNIRSDKAIDAVLRQVVDDSRSDAGKMKELASELNDKDVVMRLLSVHNDLVQEAQAAEEEAKAESRNRTLEERNEGSRATEISGTGSSQQAQETQRGGTGQSLDSCTHDEWECHWNECVWTGPGTQEGLQSWGCYPVFNCPTVETPPPPAPNPPFQSCTVERPDTCVPDQWNCNWSECSGAPGATVGEQVVECYPVYICGELNTPAPFTNGEKRQCAIVTQPTPPSPQPATTTRPAADTCVPDQWNCNWSECKGATAGATVGEQAVECYPVYICGELDTPAPFTNGQTRACAIQTPPPQACEGWICKEWSQCTWTGLGSQEGKQTRSCTKNPACPGLDSQKPSETQSCTSAKCTAKDEVYTCDAWSTCTSTDANAEKGTQERTCRLTKDCIEDTTQPTTKGEKQSCLMPCRADLYECSDWGACSTDGTQARTCKVSKECPSVQTPKPSEQQSCTPESAFETKVTITITSKGFSPDVIDIARGGRVIFVNKDTVAHNIMRNADQTGDIAPGGTGFLTMPDKRAIYTITSKQNASIVGTLVLH
ncbi:MAG TPA: DUF5667 domain-containing protein [Candidatus Kapabacteria bacterium]|nr:DUF5667 domain-containing protein [Candidatus Kapabacteria bacterium]